MRWEDLSLVEAASWRLASELVRRHPKEVRLIQAYPGGGQYNVLWILGSRGSELDITLNRTGTIQVHHAVSTAGSGGWRPTKWDEYFRSDPREFLERLERAAGLSSPEKAPASTPEAVTYRVLASLVSSTAKAVNAVRVEMGYIDSSGGGGGPNRALGSFSVDPTLRAQRPDDGDWDPGYRFWIVSRGDRPLIALEQTSATAWFIGSSQPENLMGLYKSLHREPVLVAAELLRRALA